ncbi:MAG: SDR family oxidoreductase, partial [Candidatus Latescibacteria bacterium]|nr:SDR family oxidoreductase [Candidatus Latescibacterota bacterium]
APGSPEEWSVDVNLKGTYNILLASNDEGVERFIYPSTMSIYDGNWPKEGEVFDETVPPVPKGHYSLTKYLGEEMVRCFAQAEGLSAVCLRLTGVTDPDTWERIRAEPGDHYGATHADDVGRAFRLALERPGLSGEILNICGDSPTCRWSYRRAHEVLGYAPEHRLS